MKLVGWATVGYLALVAFTNFSPSTLGPTFASLPDPGVMVGQSGATASLIDLGLAAGVYFLVIH